MADDKRRPSEVKLSERTPALEWAAAAAGLVLTFSAVGYLVFEGLRPDAGPPVLVASAAAPVRTEAGYYVPVRVENRGRSTAAGVEVEGALTSPAGEIETSTITFDYLPGGGERTGGLLFEADPGRHGLRVRARGHADP